MRIAYLSLLFILFFWGCSGPDYVSFIAFDENCWSVSDSLSFEMPQAVTTAGLVFRINLQDDYAYKNLHLKLFVQSPSGQVTDTLLNQTFLDDQGYWMTERENGIYSIEYRLHLEDMSKEGGAYQLRLIQYMRENDLCGIKSAGMYFASSDLIQ